MYVIVPPPKIFVNAGLGFDITSIRFNVHSLYFWTPQKVGLFLNLGIEISNYIKTKPFLGREI